MENHDAVAVIQRLAIDKELVDYVSRYVKDIDSATPLDEKLIDRPSDEFKKVKEKIARLATSNANIIIFGERAAWGRSRLHGKSTVEVPASTSLLQSLSQEVPHLWASIILRQPTARCTAEPELLDMVADKSFRSNLFFNLREMDVTVLPLRKSGDDIHPVAEYYLQMFAEQYGTSVKRLDASSVKALRLHDWPGNIRELRNVIRHAVINASGDLITANDISISRSSPKTSDSRKLNDPTAEKQKIIEALAQTDGNITQAAKLLGIGRTTLDYKMRNHGLKKTGV